MPISMICATEVILYNVCDDMLLGIYVLLLVVDTSQCMEDGKNYQTNKGPRQRLLLTKQQVKNHTTSAQDSQYISHHKNTPHIVVAVDGWIC